MNNYDLIVIGGGITGAGIFREAAAIGLSVLLLEGSDFSSGTSGRSSKLVHGGLRYLKQGHLHLTLDSVRHRERLLRELPGLVTELPFLMPMYRDGGPSLLQMKAGLFLYDLMAGKQRHSFKSLENIRFNLPGIRNEKLSGAFSFHDAQVDDSRLVLRLIREALCHEKAFAQNYTRVTSLAKNKEGRVTGVCAEDRETGEKRKYYAPLVVNATGVFSARLHPLPSKKLHIRPLRGSHLVFPSHILPLKTAVSFFHPHDQRPVFLIPWEGALIFGTTDEDSTLKDAENPVITRDEVLYLLTALKHLFPDAGFSEKNILSTFAGLRPVVTESMTKKPSQESREHIVWQAPGLISVTGGKLTTFRKLAWDTLKLGCRQRHLPQPDIKTPVVKAFYQPCPPNLNPKLWKLLCGRYGSDAQYLETQNPALLEFIPGTRNILAEIPLVCRDASIRHLDDLLLRRLRLGLVLADGGMDMMEEIRDLALPVLGWSPEKWNHEVLRYHALWQKNHGVPR
ncbi:glycerol-3-phosphate dehydrogenase/oxidase [Desulfobotulus mexicanus]|uniref:Glycerol-3-phosphate dehydrogenase/oxidase n=1 Tax=Desulfobotulus mexicanus TaxID=2586642 RepID=A0A5Q4VGS4_9BACT|nr:glycerol-3-phosphate dehydrogenase/oxidase [Desulfobotulus mexicanus]TYT75567.1 glycerol-3-phosphate dehydrogenase/oxidase [Desulfobotulus mexicanus]